MLYPLLKLWLYPFVNVMLRHIKGIENIPTDSNFLIVANHERHIDPIYIAYVILRHLNKKIHFIASPRFWPYLGDKICGDWLGCIPAYPGKTFNVTKQALLDEKIVGIFPEAYLNAKDRTPNSGAIKLAFETKLPILPVAIASHIIPFRSKVVFGKPIYITNKRNIKKQMFDIMDNVYKLKDDK